MAPHMRYVGEQHRQDKFVSGWRDKGSRSRETYRIVSWDGVLHLGDGRDVTALSNCILTCARLWKGAMTEGEVNLEYGKKKCDDHERVSITWPLFKRGNLIGSAAWSNSSSLLEEDLGDEPSLTLLAK